MSVTSTLSIHVHELADYNDNDNSLMSLTSTLSIHVHELADYNDNDNSPICL